jgi:RHH-type proline utilization regulon transcriptional repressor/proline dehydrogenase/delta 1-pyrroline-5-carboxylate dehydrogenase
VRYDAADLGKVLEGVNAKGYGLTMGVHSRIEETWISCVRARAAGIST